MVEATTNKRQHGEELAKTSKSRATMASEEQHKNNQYHKFNQWFGFPIIEYLP
jgi:hypothetical protein